MHADMDKSIYDRIMRYTKRGFVFLEPKEFENFAYTALMNKNILEGKKVETREIINDDGEIQTITITHLPRLWLFPSIDPHRLQETFIKRISSQKFE
jgi:hypothetical protein